jgi:hypothetical protein
MPLVPEVRRDPLYGGEAFSLYTALPFVHSNLSKTWQITTDVTDIVALKLQGPDKGISNRFIDSANCGLEGRGRPLEFVNSKSCCFYLDHL